MKATVGRDAVDAPPRGRNIERFFEPLIGFGIKYFDDIGALAKSAFEAPTDDLKLAVNGSRCEMIALGR